MRFKNIFTGQQTHAVFYDGDNAEEICEKLSVILVKRDEHIDQSAIFASRFGNLVTKADRWLYFDPNGSGIWTLKDENFRKIWIPEDEEPKNHLDFYVQKSNGVLRAAVQFDGTNALVIVHMFKEVSHFRHMPEDEVLYIKEKRDGKEIEHHIHYGGWITSSMYGDWYYPIHGVDFYDRYVKLNDNFGKRV